MLCAMPIDAVRLHEWAPDALAALKPGCGTEAVGSLQKKPCAGRDQDPAATVLCDYVPC